MWQVVFSDEFEQWFLALQEDEQDSVLHTLNLLKQLGPQLGRPHADVIHGSSISNLKELRIQHRGRPYRAFFVFDPLRQAVVLCAGDKTGNEKRFYKEIIPQAEVIYQRYLEEINENL